MPNNICDNSNWLLDSVILKVKFNNQLLINHGIIFPMIAGGYGNSFHNIQWFDFGNLTNNANGYNYIFKNNLTWNGANAGILFFF